MAALDVWPGCHLVWIENRQALCDSIGMLRPLKYLMAAFGVVGITVCTLLFGFSHGIRVSAKTLPLSGDGPPMLNCTYFTAFETVTFSYPHDPEAVKYCALCPRVKDIR